MAEAREAGAMSFFGDKYGEVVHVVTAGESVERCGGTHVSSLGRIGDFLIESEGSVGSNVRRIEALTGLAARRAFSRDRDALRATAAELKVPAGDLSTGIRRLRDTEQEREKYIRSLRNQLDRHDAAELTEKVRDGVIVARCDGRDQQAIRELIDRLRSNPEHRCRRHRR